MPPSRPHQGAGQLGNGNYFNSSSPVIVSGLADAIAVSAGDNHTCATRANGRVVCWGSNTVGQLGNNTTTDSNTPVMALNVTYAVGVTAGSLHTCSIDDDGTVHCWGAGGSGQLGGGQFVNRASPYAIGGTGYVVAVSAGSAHTCWLQMNGTVQCWGNNTYGQLGNGTFNAGGATPTNVVQLDQVTAIGTGGDHSCATLANGTTRCWGRNNSGQLGDGSFTDKSSPFTVVLTP